jgi:hypothetical protein
MKMADFSKREVSRKCGVAGAVSGQPGDSAETISFCGPFPGRFFYVLRVRLMDLPLRAGKRRQESLLIFKA